MSACFQLAHPTFLSRRSLHPQRAPLSSHFHLASSISGVPYEPLIPELQPTICLSALEVEDSASPTTKAVALAPDLDSGPAIQPEVGLLSICFYDFNP